MYFDDSFTLNVARRGVVLTSPKGDLLLYVIRLHFHATNNVAEYETLINDLCIITELGVQRLYIRNDSELIVNQVRGESNCRDSRMMAYCQEVRKLEEKFDGFELHHILRRDNEVGDTLTRLRSSRDQPPQGMFAEDLSNSFIWLEEDNPAPMAGTPSGEGGPTLTPKIDLGTPVRPFGQARELGMEIAAITGPPSSDTDWRKPISEYLQLRMIPDDEIETQRLVRPGLSA
jgi:ribonuclease HI